MLLARCAWASEPSPVEFAKSVVSERGSQTFATVSYLDRNLIVEFRLGPYSKRQDNGGPGFWRDNKEIAQGAFSKFPKRLAWVERRRPSWLPARKRKAIPIMLGTTAMGFAKCSTSPDQRITK
jgi:hypothetical protein